MNIDIHAAGTWTKMIRYASPCCASVGATTRPSHSPTIASNAAAAPNQRASRCATGKKDTGEAYLNQLIEVKCMSIQRNTNGGRARYRSADRGSEQGGAEHRPFTARREPGVRRLDRARAEDQDGDIKRQDQQREQRAAGAKSKRQRGAYRAQQRQRRRTQKQPRKQRRRLAAVQSELQRQQRRDQRQGCTTGQPMGQYFTRDQGRERVGGKGDLLQRPVGEIRCKQARQRQQRGQQRG